MLHQIRVLLEVLFFQQPDYEAVILLHRFKNRVDARLNSKALVAKQTIEVLQSFGWVVLENQSLILLISVTHQELIDHIFCPFRNRSLLAENLLTVV